MRIPKGQNYQFTIKVLEPDTFEPLDVTGYNGTVKIFNSEDDSLLSSQPITPVTGSETDGIMEATIPSADTLAVPIVKGDPSDNYYAKTRYAGFIVISKVGEVDINVSIPEVTIIPAGN